METKVIVGIDISKSWFDAAVPKGNHDKEYEHKRYANDQQGFQKFKESLPSQAHCIMEASGVYYLQLAIYLHGQSFAVSVVNPLVIRHFAKMRLMRAKTDKKDSAIIAEYGKTEKPALWKPKEPFQLELQQMQALLDNYTGQHTKLLNQKEAFTESGIKTPVVMKSLTKEVRRLDQEIEMLEKEMEKITLAHYSDLFKRIQSIPGMGKRSAMMLILITDGFTRFDNSKQISSFIGLCPRIFESGSSVKGKARICKMGMSKMRSLLYLCAMRARTCNRACREMFERLKAKGKNGKLILVALANKLIRQAFALAKGQKYYQEIIVN